MKRVRACQQSCESGAFGSFSTAMKGVNHRIFMFRQGNSKQNFGLTPLSLSQTTDFAGLNYEKCKPLSWRIIKQYWRHGMTSSATHKHRTQRGFIPHTALAQSVSFDDSMMHVSLSDGRIISVPLLWFPPLYQANPDQRSGYIISGGGIGLHWPDIDEDISVAGLLTGADHRSR